MTKKLNLNQTVFELTQEYPELVDILAGLGFTEITKKFMLQDETIATYQTLPWGHRGWHAGGAANNTHTSFEICEDGLADRSYFEKVYKEAIELCAYLCRLYHLNPLGDGVIIGHYESYQRGFASNHGDPRHWFSRFGKSMDTFRQDVKKLMAGSPVTPKPNDNPPSKPEGGFY